LGSHNARYISNFIYRLAIAPGAEFGISFISPILNRLLSVFPILKKISIKIANFISSNYFYVAYPIAKRNLDAEFDGFKQKSPFPNGMIAIKYWPIDTYEELFNNESLEENIKNGYLLNDLAFFVDQGVVELWSKEDTLLDRENSVIIREGEQVKFDAIIDGDRETPNLPPITINKEQDLDYSYQYFYRDTYMGVIPKDLNNIFLIGYARPTTGGLNNIIEMQSLFVHKLIINKEFHTEVYRDIDKKIESYNAHYYPARHKSPTDHLVFFGFYTEDMAKIVGINLKLSQCKNFKETVSYFTFPNNAFKYRQRGPYKVEGVKELVDKINKKHSYFMSFGLDALCFAFDQLALLLLFLVIMINLPFYYSFIMFPLYLISIYPTVKASMNFSFSSMVLGPVFYCMYLLALLISIYSANYWVFISVLPIKWGLTYVLRKLGRLRVIFNDLKIRREERYKSFFVKYCAAFNKCFDRIED